MKNRGRKRQRREEKRREEEIISEKRKGQKKEDAGEPSGRMRDEQLHVVVARSTCRSETVESTPFSDHSWKLRCWTGARRCGATHISKSKVLKTDRFGALLEVEMLKKCTPLWREAHFEVNMFLAHLHLLYSGSVSSLIFFLLLFSSLNLPTCAFHLSALSEVWLLNFLRSSTSTLPVVPRKAVAEVSKIRHYLRGELLSCMDGRRNPLMDHKVVGAVPFGAVAGHLTHNCWM